MAMKRNYATNPPAKLTELNKESMLAYVAGLNSDEDLVWFIDLLDTNTVTKTLNFDTTDGKRKKGDEIKGYNLPVIRKEFAKKYFPALLEKKAKTVSSFEKKLEELRKKVNK